MPRSTRSPAWTWVLLALAAAGLFVPAEASAAPIRVIQEWDDVNIASSGRTARTGATYDPATLTGVGIEMLEIQADFFLGLSINGVGQISTSLTNNPPLASNQEGTVFASFLNGVFRGLRNIDQGGNPAAQLYNTSFPQPNNGGTVIMGDANMQYGFPVSGATNYLLTSTQFVSIPEPRAALLIGLGLLSLTSRRRAGSRRAGDR